MSPRRIQMSRKHRWRADHPDAVIVARPSKFGNPFRVGASRGDMLLPMTAQVAVATFRRWLTTKDSQPPHGVERAVILNSLYELTGRDLACWCPLDQPCHADVLLAIANSTQDGPA